MAFGPYILEYTEPTPDDHHQSYPGSQVADPDGSLHQRASKVRESKRETVPNGFALSNNHNDSPSQAIGSTSESRQTGPYPDTGIKIKNVILEQVLTGFDLNGDGIVSQTEGIKNAAQYNIAAKLFEKQDDKKGNDVLSILA
jgi:hypothetical protein